MIHDCKYVTHYFKCIRKMYLFENKLRNLIVPIFVNFIDK